MRSSKLGEHQLLVLQGKSYIESGLKCTVLVLHRRAPTLDRALVGPEVS